MCITCVVSWHEHQLSNLRHVIVIKAWVIWSIHSRAHVMPRMQMDNWLTLGPGTYRNHKGLGPLGDSRSGPPISINRFHGNIHIEFPWGCYVINPRAWKISASGCNGHEYWIWQPKNGEHFLLPFFLYLEIDKLALSCWITSVCLSWLLSL